jgi:hypothetical protein
MSGGAGAALAVFALGVVALDKSAALSALGLITFTGLWLPTQFAPNILGRGQAAGRGPALHRAARLRCVGTDLRRVLRALEPVAEALVATKAAIQTVGHALKFGYFTQVLLLSGESNAPMAALLAMALAPVGTQLSSRALDAISDDQFRTWSRWLIAALAAFYLASGLAMRFGQ